MTHEDRSVPNEASAAFDFRKLDASELPSEILRRNLREVRKARGLTQKQLAEQMTIAGTPMTNVTISNIEQGSREVSVDELFVFAAVLERPIVRLSTPHAEEETQVRVTARRVFRPVALRNWIVYGDPTSPAARGAQQMMRLAYDSLILLEPRHEQHREEAKARLHAVLKEIRH